MESERSVCVCVCVCVNGLKRIIGFLLSDDIPTSSSIAVVTLLMCVWERGACHLTA